MPLKIGDIIFCKYQNRCEQYKTEVLSLSDVDIVVRQREHVPTKVFKGQSVFFVFEREGYLAEIKDVEGDKISMRYVTSEERGSFHVEDVMPVIIQKIDEGIYIKRAKVISERGVELTSLRKFAIDVPDETINPLLWKMLVEISTKLSMILDMLTLGKEGLMNAEETRLNLSAAGVSLNVKERFKVRDCVEVKLLLQTSPPVGIVVYGIVVRVKEVGLPPAYELKDMPAYEIGIAFVDMEEDVKDELIQYTLKREREILRRQRTH
ncbi:MAG: PilZ domain-containing protein [Nitrospirae bacterium]|nr:PilZ domain-containing protein [Nitrospirota bacterium]